MAEEDGLTFKKHMNAVYRQSPVDQLDFLYLCVEAAQLAKKEPWDREVIASRIAHIWHTHYDQLDYDARLVGGLFADLELPDGHIDTHKFSVNELWENLEFISMTAVHDRETGDDKLDLALGAL